METIRNRVGKRSGKRTVSWQAVVRRGDHPRRRKTFKRKTGAEAWATEIEGAIVRRKKSRSKTS